MKDRSEEIYFFLSIFFSFLLIACSVCAQDDELIEIDLLSSPPTLERPELKDLEADKQEGTKIFAQHPSPAICFSSFFFIDQLPHFWSPILYLPRSISVLRC